MPRLAALDPTEATGKAKELLNGVQETLGMTPNLVRTMANSPAVLEAYLGFNTALSRGRLGGKVREQIALAVAETNGCEYCLSAHTAIGKKVGLPEEDLLTSRQWGSSDPKATAALEFARAILARRGQVTDADLTAVRNAGYGDTEIAEIVANVALNIFTNYFNLVAETTVDFPRVELGTQVACVDC
ncbi:MAG: carboxymuconolactone decarboxylase family protein [Candidatus Methylomirabilota bacterium]